MGLDVKVGTFVSSFAGAPQAITGLGFQPKFVLFWTLGIGNPEGVPSTFTRFNFGLSDSISEYSISYNSGGNIGQPTNAFRSFQGRALVSNGGNPENTTRNNDIAVLSLDADGFTIQDDGVDDDNDIYYSAFGGTDILDYTIDAFDSIDGSDLQTISLGYKADLLCIFGARTAPGVDDSGKVLDACITYGWATLDNQAAIGLSALDNQALSQTRSTLREEAIAVFDEGGDVLGSRAFLSAFGQTTLIFDWERSSSYRYAYLAIRGVTARIGGVNSPERASRRSVVGAGFRPKWIMPMLSSVSPSTPTIQPGATYSIGIADATSQFVLACSDPDGRTPAIGKRQYRQAAIMVQAPNGVVRAIGSLDTFNASGFEIDWASADPPALRFNYLALGDSEYPVEALVNQDNAVIAVQEGQEFGMPLRVASAVWTGAAAKGHSLIVGESSALGDPNNTIINLIAVDEGASIPVPLSPLTFANGFSIVRIDSGSLILLKQPNTTPITVETSIVGDTPLIAAPGAGLSIYVRSLYVTGTAVIPVANLVGAREGALGTFRWLSTLLTAGGASTLHASIAFDPAWRLPENTALVANQTQADVLEWTIDATIAAA